MSDAFAALGLPRSPLADPQEIQGRFRDLAARLHPDRCGGDPAPLARLNAARQTLLSDAARLRHLLELSFPHFPIPQPPAPDFALFSKIGKLRQDAESLAAKRARASSALATALVAQEAAALESALANTSEILRSLRADVETGIRRADELWPDVPPEDLAALAGRAVYCERWRESLRETQTLLAGG